MKSFAFAAALLALSAVSPARADYAVVRFGDGFCRVWWNSYDNPGGPTWTKVAIGLPDYDAARAVLNAALVQGVCR
jgi:hypothetical protein